MALRLKIKIKNDIKSRYLMTRLKQIKLNMIQTEKQLKYLHYQL